jgi:pimeloyl-ACP methyl ester carboxylesterase
MFDQGLPYLLGSVDTPTLVVSSEHDQVVPASCGRRYAEILPNARLELLAGSGHCADVEQPEELTRVVTGFIS